MLTNFNCGVLYVSKEWEIPKPTEVSDLPSPTNDLLDDEGNENEQNENQDSHDGKSDKNDRSLSANTSQPALDLGGCCKGKVSELPGRCENGFYFIT